MMGFSVVFIFALLQICTLCDGGNSEDLSNITDSSNHHHHLHPRQLLNRRSAEKEEDQSPVDIKNYLEFVVSKDPPKDAVLVSHNDEDYYILGTGKCDKMKLDIIKSSEISSKGANTAERTFLVNKDNFEILEWKRWEEIQSGQISFHSFVICKSIYIAKDNNGIRPVTNKFFLKKNNMQSEVLSLNNDIKEQRLDIYNYVVNEEKKSEREEVLKHFTAHNMNCKSAKHVVKLDHGSDKSRAFLKGRTHTVGGVIEASVSGDILKIVKVGGKIGAKYDQSRLNSETQSKLNKVLHSVSMEIEIPPNQSCVIEILSKTFIAQVPYSGELIRLYNNGEDRLTSITGIYDHQEITDLETFVYPCTPVTDATKCPNA